MSTTESEIKIWENPECPAKFQDEVFPPTGLLRISSHHIKWYRRPFFLYRGWWWWRWWQPNCCCCCCCCCEGARHTVSETSCWVNGQLAPNTFGPGRAIRVLRTLQGYHVEFMIEWTAGGNGQITVDVDLIQAPAGTPVPQRVAGNRGPSDSVAFGGTLPGTYVFRVTARSSMSIGQPPKNTGNRRYRTPSEHLNSRVGNFKICGSLLSAYRQRLSWQTATIIWIRPLYGPFTLTPLLTQPCR